MRHALAGLERRLVWQDDSAGFALLEPPLSRPEIWRRRRVDRIGLLRWVDHHWGLLMFAVPCVVLLALSVVLAIWLRQPTAAILVVLVAVLYVAVVMTALPIWQLIAGRRDTAQKRALGSVTADQWTMPLFHQENEQRIDELLDRVRNRLSELVEDEVQQAARDRGGEVGVVRTSTELACPHAGVTTDAAIERIAARYPLIHSEVSMARFDRRPDDPDRRPYRPIPFFLLYVGAIAIVVLAVAAFVADVEGDACAPDRCAQAPATYPRALAWAAYRLLGMNVPGVVPTTGYTLTLGWLITLLAITAVPVGIVAVQAQLRATKKEKEGIVNRLDARGQTRLLLVTVADEECEAVLDTIEQHVGRTVAPRFDQLVPVYEMGEINDTEIFVVQATQGVNAAGGAIVLTGQAITQIDPHYALIVGMCYGLRPDRQRLGDILVSEKVRDLDPGKLVDPDGGEPGGKPVEILRGESVNPSPMLVTAIKAARREWSRTRADANVDVGLMLAWGKLVNSEPTVRQLRKEHPDAIGADMEGAGFYAAARAGRVESIIIKAICDWGHGRDADVEGLAIAKRDASRNSATFVLHLVLTGVFSRSPTERLRH